MPQAAVRSTEALQAVPMRPDWSRGRTISPSARGDTTAPHGPLQRLLGGTLNSFTQQTVHLSRKGPEVYAQPTAIVEME